METDKEEIIIKVSKKKTFLLTLMTLVFLFVLGWFLFKVLMLPDAFNKSFLTVCISLLIIAFGIGFISGLLKLIDSEQGLIINNKGIQINTGPNRGHFVQWNEITELKTHNRTQGPIFLLIFVKNPEDVINELKGLKRFLIKMNNVSHKTPLSLTATWLECSFYELLSIIEDKYKKNVA